MSDVKDGEPNDEHKLRMLLRTFIDEDLTNMMDHYMGYRTNNGKRFRLNKRRRRLYKALVIVNKRKP